MDGVRSCFAHSRGESECAKREEEGENKGLRIEKSGELPLQPGNARFMPLHLSACVHAQAGLVPHGPNLQLLANFLD